MSLSPVWDGARAGDQGLKVDVPELDLGDNPDGLPQDPGGPAIAFLVPKQGATVIGDSLKVQVKITDPDGVDDATVKLTIQGSKARLMSVSPTPQVYESLLDITGYSSSMRLWVVAADLDGHRNSEVVEFRHDTGPTIQFLEPTAGSRWKDGVPISVVASDKLVDPGKFQVSIGAKILGLAKTTEKGRVWLKGTIKFNDFKPALSGKQLLVAEASNKTGAKSTATRGFVVDDAGPEIDIISHQSGDLIGGIIKIRAKVTDEAGVLASSVVAVIGNKPQVKLTAAAGAKDTYEGAFDTRTLDQTSILPTLSVRASDKLGNESHEDFKVALDNGRPIVELDPPRDYHLTTKVASGAKTFTLCSRPFDPVGYYAANDLHRVPQLQPIRAQIEDIGNYSPSCNHTPYAKVDPGSVWLYVLDDTQQPLVVDTDDDGYCDAINPKVIPASSSPKPGEAVAIHMASVTPTGSANFLPPDRACTATDPCPPGIECVKPPGASKGFCQYPTPAGCDGIGGETYVQPPKPLCKDTAVSSCLDGYWFASAKDCQHSVVVSGHAPNGKEPAIYTIPNKNTSATWDWCMGLPFDFKGNAISDGWACAAVEAKDKLGNRGVSPPIRLWVDSSWAAYKSLPVSAATAASAPHCRGIMDKSGNVTSTTPCKFKDPRSWPGKPSTCTDNYCSDCSAKANTFWKYPQKFEHCRVLE